jgi:hypothetical protein
MSSIIKEVSMDPRRDRGRNFILSFLALAALLTFERAPAGTKDGVHPIISQIIEKHNGRTSCRGVIIELSSMRFSRSFSDGTFTATDAKYGRDLKPLLSWIIDKTRKRLTIMFRKGDFGSGNVLTLRIAGSAFESDPDQSFDFTIPTDPL